MPNICIVHPLHRYNEPCGLSSVQAQLSSKPTSRGTNPYLSSFSMPNVTPDPPSIRHYRNPSSSNLATILHPLDVLRTELVPVPQATHKRRSAESGGCDDEHCLQAGDVGIDDDRDLLCRERVADFCGACSQGHAGVDAGKVLDEVFDELVVETALGGGDEEGAADSEEDCEEDCVSCRSP